MRRNLGRKCPKQSQETECCTHLVPTSDLVVRSSWSPISLKTLTSLNKEVRPFFLSDNSIWSLASASSHSDYSIWRSWRLFYPCDHSIWGIWVHCPQILLSLRKNGQEESRLLNLRRLRSSRLWARGFF